MPLYGRVIHNFPERGCKPKPPKIPLRQIEPRYDRIEIDDLPVPAESVVPVQMDVAPLLEASGP
jgi:hypothetical protein